MEIVTKNFKSLSLEELYEILQLRTEVFVLEQDCIYQDIDGKDMNALHILGRKNGKLIAYARCFEPGVYSEEGAIGRVIVKKSERGKKYGHSIMNAAIDVIIQKNPEITIRLSAQKYLIGFYESHGFETKGEGYLEDGIPHILMLKKPWNKEFFTAES